TGHRPSSRSSCRPSLHCLELSPYLSSYPLALSAPPAPGGGAKASRTGPQPGPKGPAQLSQPATAPPAEAGRSVGHGIGKDAARWRRWPARLTIPARSPRISAAGARSRRSNGSPGTPPCRASPPALLATAQVRFYHDHVLVKEGGTRQRTPWHQDQPYYNVDG